MYNTILVPVMLDDEHDNSVSFEAAKALSNEGAKLILLHVLEMIPSYASFEIPTDVMEAARREVQESLSARAQSLPNATAAVISGHAGSSIVDFATQEGADCIVIASHRPGFSDLFLGSTASRVVRHAKCAVHVLR